MGQCHKNKQREDEKAIRRTLAIHTKVAAEELDQPTPPDFATICKEKVAQTIEKIDKALSSSKAGVSKQVIQKLNYAKNNWPAALDKYEAQEKILDGATAIAKQTLMPLL